MPAPIILFTYNRILHAEQAIRSLAANDLAKDSELFVFSDGPKDETERPIIEEIRHLIRETKGFKDIHLIERSENWGLARNVIDGVTSLVNLYGEVIVVEADLVVSPYFLRFMNDALATYRDEPRVGHIQAYDFTQDKELPETFLIKWTGSWGWAPWKRAWQYFNPDGKYLLHEIESRGLSYTFDFNGKYGFTRMLRRQTEGKNNSWAIRWNASLFLQDILSLNVGRSLVQNNGFDGSGTNCGGGHLYSADIYLLPICVEKISPITENLEARRAFSQYYARTNSFIAKAIRRIKRTLRGDFGA